MESNYPHELLTQMLKTTPDLVFFKDLDLRYYAFSDAFLHFNGLSASDIFMKTLADIVGDERVAREFMQKDIEIIETGVPSRTESWVKAPNGNEALFDIIVSPVRDSHEKIIGLMGIGRDITHIRRAEQEIGAKNAELARSSAELDGLVYKAAHDLRAPLANLLGLNSLLARAQEWEDVRKLLQLQSAQLQKMDGFIQEIVDLTRNQRMELQKIRTDIVEMVNRVWNDLGNLRGQERMRLTVKVEGEVPFIADPLRLPIVLHNLLSNAVIFQDMEKVVSLVTVWVVLQQDEAVIRVEDNGIGIGSEDLNRIFEMFYRGSSQSLGSGLGLYISQDAVSKMNGTLSVASEKGTGTVFTLTLPNYPSEAAANA